MNTSLGQMLNNAPQHIDYFEWIAMVLGIDLGRTTTIQGIKKKIKEAVLEHPQEVLHQLPLWELSLIHVLIMQESIVAPDYTALNTLLLVDEYEDSEGYRLHLTEDVKAAFEPHIEELLDLNSAEKGYVAAKQTDVLLNGILNIYGVVTMKDLKAIFSNLDPSNTSIDEMMLLYSQISSFYRISIEDWGKGSDDFLFVSRYAGSYGSILKNRAKHPELKDYRAFSFDDYADAGTFPVITIPNPYNKEMLHFLNKHCHLNELDAKLEIMDLWMQIVPDEERIVEIFKYFCEDYDLNENSVDEFLKIFTNFANNMPRWDFKGYTPNELSSPYRQESSAKVGRNDPCPCGSGKKYKHCCGAN